MAWGLMTCSSSDPLESVSMWPISAEEMAGHANGEVGRLDCGGPVQSFDVDVVQNAGGSSRLSIAAPKFFESCGEWPSWFALVHLWPSLVVIKPLSPACKITLTSQQVSRSFLFF